MKNIENIIIREGKTEDLPSVLNLVKELAQYEKAPDEVTVTLTEMEEEGFGVNPLYKFFVAELNKEIIGIALYYYKYSTWKGRCIFLEDIIVTEKWRGNAIGMKLFNEITKVAYNQKVKRIEWQVLNWNEPAINFYNKMPVLMDNEWINCKMTDIELKQIYG